MLPEALSLSLAGILLTPEVFSGFGVFVGLGVTVPFLGMAFVSFAPQVLQVRSCVPSAEVVAYLVTFQSP